MAAGAETPPLPAPEPVKDARVKVLACDLGARLPVGYLMGGTLHKDLAFRRFTTRIERELDELRRENKGVTHAEWVTLVLARMIARFGPHDFDSLSDPERRLVILQSFLADVFYALVQFRIAALGPEIRFNLSCAACGNEWRAPADLGTVDVHTTEAPASLARTHRLRDGFEAGGKVYRDLVIDPARWQAMVAGRRGSRGDLDLGIVLNSIRHALPEGGGPTLTVAWEHLDDWSKFDLEHLRADIDRDHLGADLELESVCPKCEHKTKHGLDWTWDFFFKSASL